MTTANDELNAQIGELMVQYNGPEYLAFKDAPGWYVYEWQLLGEAAGTQSHGYKIISGPHTTMAHARTVEQLTKTRGRVVLLHTELVMANASIATLADTIDELRAIVRMWEGTTTELRATVEDKDRQITELRANHNRLMNEHDRVWAEFEEARATIEDRDESIAEMWEELAELEKLLS